MAPAVFLQLDAKSMEQIRKTKESPPRLSVYDLIQWVTGLKATHARTYWYRLRAAYPEVATRCGHLKFPGSGQKETPTTDTRGAVEITIVLQGKKAAEFRKKGADVICRHLGGDLSLVDEILANRLAQERLAAEQPSHPARIFGETVEAEVPELRTKLCSSCCSAFPVDCFRKDSATTDGLYCQCRACEKEDRDERQKRLREEPEQEDEPERKRVKPQEQTLYVVSVKMPGIDDCTERMGYKIGRTIDTDCRFDSILGSLPMGEQIDLVVHALYPNAGHLERSLHRRFKDRQVESRRSKEWFRVPLTEILNAITELLAK